MATVHLNHIYKRWGPVVGVNDFDLAIEDREFLVMLGPSGCGKTTTMRMIAGLEDPSEGEIVVDGQVVNDLEPKDRDVAMVFQNYGLYPNLSVYENIRFPLKVRKVEKAEHDTRVRRAAEMVELGDLLTRLPRELSGGQRQRVALGRALAIDPRILLLDEPLSNLDARIRQTVRHEIKGLQAQLGITAVHVTHDREEAMVMADRIVILDAGEIAQLGTPEEVYNRPASPFVAAFMGADNIIDVAIERDNGAVRIPATDHNEPAVLQVASNGAGGDDEGVHIVGTQEGTARAHFRSEAAALTLDEALPANSLTLRGTVSQSSYPGGFYRYTVSVGDKQFMVDDPRRLNIGAPVGVCLPAAALHLYGQ